MKIKIGMMYDDGVPFGREVEAINRDWAARHGYAFVSQQALPNPRLDPYWNRIPFIRQNLDGCDWFFWMDADVIVVNQGESIEPHLPEQDIVFSQDYSGLCCGAFAVRNCDWSRIMLDTWLLVGRVDENAWRVFDDKFMREQTTMKALLRIFPDLRKHVGALSQDVIQNMYSRYCAQAVAIHTWAGWTGPNMVRLVLSRLKEGGYRQGIME